MDEKFADYLLRKTEADYDRMASDFSVTRAFPWEEMKVLVDQYVETGDRILDAGCGNGRLYELLKNKNVTYEGIDASQPLIDIARRRYGARFSRHNLIDLSGLADHSFSLIFCVATFQHIPGWKYRLAVLNNFHRLLLPQGYLLMINWNILHQEKFRPYLQKSSGLFRKGNFDAGDFLYPWKTTAEPIYRYYHGFDEAELASLLGQSGFELEEQYYARHGQRASAETGYNIITAGRKISNNQFPESGKAGRPDSGASAA